MNSSKFSARRSGAFLAALGIAVFFASCASSDPFVRLDGAVVAEGNYALGLALIDESLAEGGEPLYDAKIQDDLVTGGNALSLLLDRGLLAHYGALHGQTGEDGSPMDFRVSAESLAAAEELIEAAKAGSAGQSLLTFIANDNSRDYGGEIYEDIYLTIFKALNYYHLEEFDNAFAMIRSVQEKITAYSDEAGSSLDLPANQGDAADEESSSLLGGIGNVLSAVRDGINTVVAGSYASLGAGPEPVQFTNSALAAYLAALAFRAAGDEGNARVSLVNLNRAFTQKGIYEHPVPASLVIAGESNRETAEELVIPAGKSRLNVLAFAGLSPVKREAAVPVPLPGAFFKVLGQRQITLYLPGLFPRSSLESDEGKIEVSI